MGRAEAAQLKTLDGRGKRRVIFTELCAPVTNIRQEFAEVITAWSWLIGEAPEPLLLTLFGDVFVRRTNGSVWLLDTYKGTLSLVAPSVQSWKALLQNPDRVFEWFHPDWLSTLKEGAAIALADQEVYSPIIPPILGGAVTAKNYTPSRFSAHIHAMGQIHQQVKDLPDGTPITKIHVEPR